MGFRGYYELHFYTFYSVNGLISSLAMLGIFYFLPSCYPFVATEQTKFYVVFSGIRNLAKIFGG